MSTTGVETRSITLPEYLTLPEQDEEGLSYELSGGELIRVSPTGRSHGRRIDRILRYLYRQLDETQFDILTGEPGFILKRDPNPTVRSADIAVLPYVEDPKEGMIEGPPLLAIEVVSPSNDPDEIETKRLQYLAAGAQELWIVYDRSKTIHVSQP